MLTTLLNTIPLTKFVLIQDTLEERATKILNYLIKTHKQRNLKINYFVFDGVFNRVKNSYQNINIQLHDCVSESLTIENFKKKLKNDGVFVIDSLSNAIIHFGVGSVYRALHDVCSGKDTKQVIAILHNDVLEEQSKTIECLEHLATCSIKMFPKSELYNRRISFVYKKVGGKIIRGTEDFYFENDNLITEPIKKIDVIEKNVGAVGGGTLPENLTTFKISLEDKEKESRDKLVLPYLPQESGGTSAGESKIFYQFDHVDDWDEEDPDDDLDI